MLIIPCNKVIGMTNYPKDEESSFKNEKKWAFHFLKKSSNLQKSVKFIKEKLGEAIFKTAPFGAQCTNWTQTFFKSCVFIEKIAQSQTA